MKAACVPPGTASGRFVRTTEPPETEASPSRATYPDQRRAILRSGGSPAGGACRGGRSANSSSVAAATFATARSTASAVRAVTVCTPPTFRTYWRAAARISALVASGWRPRRMVMFRHMAAHGRGLYPPALHSPAMPDVDDVAESLRRVIAEARAERAALADERRVCHEAAKELKEAVRLAREEIRQSARAEARKALVRQLGSIVEGLRTKD